MSRDTGASPFLVVGRVAGYYGVKGWVKLYSHTQPMENILKYRRYAVCQNGVWRDVEIDQGRVQGKGVVAHFVGRDDRDAVADLQQCDLAIPRASLPELAEGDYYWHQLEGLRVITAASYGSRVLGRVDHLMETGANDVLVVVPCEGSIDQRERLLPYLPGQYVTRIDLASGEMEVDWDPEF